MHEKRREELEEEITRLEAAYFSQSKCNSDKQDDAKQDQDFWEGLFDVVKSQGAYLKSLPATPIFHKQNVEHFAAELSRKLEIQVRIAAARRNKHGDAADEWPPGHTPIEVVEQRKAEVEELFARMEASSSSSEGEPEDPEEVSRCRAETTSTLAKIKAQFPQPKCANDKIDDLSRNPVWKGFQYENNSQRLDQPRLPTPSPSNSEVALDSTSSSFTSPNPKLEKRRQRRLNADRAIVAQAECQVLDGLDNTVAELPTIVRKRQRCDNAGEESQHKKKRRVDLADVVRPRRSARLRKRTR